MDERAQIEAAMGRLLDGVPLRSDGKLTIVSLAIEAGLKRHVLTHKHTDLRDRFYAKVKAQNAVPASETALREQNAALRRQLEDLRTERDEYKQAVGALARTLNLLTAENDDLHRQITQLRRRTAPLTAVEARP
jgi:chromosome segregation ATPase